MPFTTAPADKLEAIAQALATAFDAIPDLTVYSYDPIGADMARPALGVGGLQVGGTALGEAGQQLGSQDWPQNWRLTLYVDLVVPEAAYPQARSFIGQMVTAIDADPTLGGEVQEARITEIDLDPNEPEEQHGRMLIGEVTVAVIHLMSNPT